MKAALKNSIRTILPEPVLMAGLDVRDRLQLARLSKLSFDYANLCAANDVSLDAIFNDKDIEASWTQDRETIRSVFAEDDRYGGVNPGDRRAIYHLVRKLKPQTLLEVGTHIGASTLHIAAALKVNGSGAMTTVDIEDVNDPENGPWKRYGEPSSPAQNLEKIGCRDLVTFKTCPALDVLTQTDKTYDFIFLDGDHSSQAVYQEVSAALKILNPGGMILLHDFYPDGRALFPDDNIIAGPWRAVRRIESESPGLKILPLGNLPWPTKQGTNVTSLALATRD